MRVLITGGNGMLGSDLVPIFSEVFEIIVPKVEEFDVTKYESIISVMKEGKFDWVLHMAALTDLDWCEEHPDEARKINSKGTENIARACAATGCKMAYISTSGVFSGKLGRPYSEEDMPRPANIYGRTKYEGEKAVEAILPPEKRLVLRAGWLFGGGKADKKFVGKIFNIMRTHTQVQAVADIWGSPNYSVDIAKLLVYMLGNNFFGLFHIANSGEPASRYDMAVAIRDAAGFNSEIEAVPATRFPTKAFRPPMEAIVSVRLEAVTGFSMRHWREALAEYVKRLLTIC